MKHLLCAVFLSSTLSWAQTQSTMTVSNGGVFTNTQINTYVQSLLNSCDPLTEYQASEGSQYVSAAVAGCTAAPSGSTVHEGVGLIGWVNNLSTSTNVVGVHGTARSLATNAGVWGGDFTVSDGGFSNNKMYGIEIDVDSQNAATLAAGISFGGVLQPGNLITAIQIPPMTGVPFQQGLSFLPVSGVAPCTFCVDFQTGATPAPSGSAAAILFSPVATGTNQVSQGLEFVAGDPSSGNNLVAVKELANGNLSIANSKSGTGLVGNNIPIVTSFTTTAATSDNVTVNGMTASGHCVLTPTNSGAAAGIASVYVSAKATSQIAVTHTATSGWKFDVMCTPN